MREKRGRKENPRNLDPIGEDGVTRKQGKGFFACYLLTSLSPRHKGHTYIGFTVNPRRRIRQHNGEITSGAFRTKRKRPWEMILCIYGFPTNVSALQFEWAWQHPRESIAVREAAAAFKSFSGFASKIKLAYTMINLPDWKSLNLTVNYFSTKYAHHGGLSPSLPPHMKVQVCAIDDLPYFTKLDKSSQPEDEDSPDVSEENEEEDSRKQCQLGNSSSSSSSLEDSYPSEKERHDRHFEKAKQPEIVCDDRLANFTGFGSLEEIVEDEVYSHGTLGSTEAMEKETNTTLDDRVTNLSRFGLLEDEEAMEKDYRRRTNPISPTTTEVEVIDLMTPSPSWRVGSSMKRRRVSELIDLTMSPNFIEL